MKNWKAFIVFVLSGILFMLLGGFMIGSPFEFTGAWYNFPKMILGIFLLCLGAILIIGRMEDLWELYTTIENKLTRNE